MALSSGCEIPAKSWQLRSALAIPICLSSANVVVMRCAGLVRFAPEVNNPTAALAALDLRREALAAEQLNQRRWQERRDDNEAILRFKCLDALEYFRQRLCAMLEQWAHVKPFEM